MLLVFEEAMGIKPQQVSLKEFLQINSLREYSLLKFYNTASKSRYSFICQNVHAQLSSTQASRICIKIERNHANSKIKTFWSRCVVVNLNLRILSFIVNLAKCKSATIANCCILSLPSLNATIAQLNAAIPFLLRLTMIPTFIRF